MLWCLIVWSVIGEGHARSYGSNVGSWFTLEEMAARVLRLRIPKYLVATARAGAWYRDSLESDNRGCLLRDPLFASLGHMVE
jgi:hypothetical protein